ncbi:MAG: tRNA (adenosine(37)-N6)-threonylcarbamoyltransferase complex dimerization subunit type 1 TsaB [Candidatus Saccharimonadales bacterium]
MLIITFRTDKPEAEIGLYEDEKQLAYETWTAHRQLAETIHAKLRDILAKESKNLKDIGGIVAYKGPGSFTGLRIGLTVTNTLAYALDVPLTGTTGQQWLKTGIIALLAGNAEKLVVPEYGAPVHITAPKH